MNEKRKYAQYAKKLLLNLPRHMTGHKVHGWSLESAGAAVSVFGLRKKYTRNEKKTTKYKSKNYHQQKICQLPNCMRSNL